MVPLQRLCAMFLAHFGVNLWILNDELMSAYDVAVANRHVSIARFLDAAASQALVDNLNGMMKLCRRAADNARRRLGARRQPSARRPRSVDLHVDHKPRNTSQLTNGWGSKSVPDGASSSSVKSFTPSSSMFQQTPRLANGRLFPTANNAATPSHSVSTDWRKRRRFWPISTSHVVGHGRQYEQPSRVAAAVRQLLLMIVQDDSLHYDTAQYRVAREQLRLLSLAESRYTTTEEDNMQANSFTPCCGIDSQFYCRPRVSDDVSAVQSSEVVGDSTHARSEVWEPVLCTVGKYEKAASRRHIQTTDVTSETATDRTSNSSSVNCLHVDCIQRHTVTNHPAGRSSGSNSHQSSRPPSKSGHPQTQSVDVSSDDDRLRHWLANNGLAEYWSLLAMEKIDLETLTLLEDDDLRQLGIPMGPRRRLQRVVKQLQCQSQQSLPTATAESVNTRL